MDELQSRKDIDKISIDILKQSKAIDIFPTPIDKIIHYSDLIFENSIDLSKVDNSFLSRVSDAFLSAWSSVRGFLDRREKTIYLDLSQLPTRQNFVKLHEVGHQVLPWQNQILQYMDTDDTLSASVKEEFEAEANYFASATLFQQDRFISEMEKLNLSLKSGMALGKIFGGSTHAALRRLVECSSRRCALLVLEKIKNAPKNQAQCKQRDLFFSTNFKIEFGTLNLPNSFGYKWDFAKDYIFNKKLKEDGLITLDTLNGPTTFNYHFFNNNYNAFVFFFPIGEKQHSRTKIVITKY